MQQSLYLLYIKTAVLMTGCTGSGGPVEATGRSHDTGFDQAMDVADSLYDCMQFRDAYKLYVQLLDSKEAEADSAKRLRVLNALSSTSELSGHKVEQPEMPPAEYRKKELRKRTHETVNSHIINCLILLFLFVGWGNGRAQTVIGTVGMMNVPTADMRPAGTFDGGASIVQKELLYQKSYYTYLYYIDFTPFSWLEITLRETLIKTSKSKTEPDKIGFYQQDRSSTIRVRPLKEGKYWPAVVIGVNDIYASKEGGSQYACVYGVVSKHFQIAAIGTFEVTAGYARPHKVGIKEGTTYDGIMGGLSFAPTFFQDMRIMAEYDTEGFNVGVSAFLLRHLNITCFTREFKGFNATVSYQYTIPY